MQSSWTSPTHPVALDHVVSDHIASDHVAPDHIAPATTERKKEHTMRGADGGPSSHVNPSLNVAPVAMVPQAQCSDAVSNTSGAPGTTVARSGTSATNRTSTPDTATAPGLRAIPGAPTSSAMDTSTAPVSPTQVTAQAKVLPVSSFRLKGLLMIDRRFSVPLDYTGVLPGEITIFAREVVLAGPNDTRSNLPYLLFLQGGPGYESPRMTEAGEFRKFARDHRLLLLDQRGTGLSTPISPRALLDFRNTEQAVAYLKCFRAPSIVRDAELIRKALISDDGRWSILGQSFGGFCVLTYLSQFPWHLHRAYLAGGIPPVSPGCSAELVYRSLAPRVLRQMDLYYATFPGDEQILRELVLFLDSQPSGCVALPSGSVLSTRGLQALGLQCLGFPGSFARLHYALERAWEVLPSSGERVLSSYFLRTVESFFTFDTNPLYFMLHESIYCNGPCRASDWAAERVVMGEFPLFRAGAEAAAGRRVYLTGEMVFPFMLDEFASLRPLKEIAQAVATVSSWEPLYNEEMLRTCSVPTAAAVYFNDMCVDFNLSMDTIAKSTIRPWITSEYTHAGIREGSDRVIEMLTSMVSGKTTLEC